jgi:hypothetical protein
MKNMGKKTIIVGCTLVVFAQPVTGHAQSITARLQQGKAAQVEVTNEMLDVQRMQKAAALVEGIAKMRLVETGSTHAQLLEQAIAKNPAIEQAVTQMLYGTKNASPQQLEFFKMKLSLLPAFSDVAPNVPGLSPDVIKLSDLILAIEPQPGVSPESIKNALKFLELVRTRIETGTDLRSVLEVAQIDYFRETSSQLELRNVDVHYNVFDHFKAADDVAEFKFGSGEAALSVRLKVAQAAAFEADARSKVSDAEKLVRTQENLDPEAILDRVIESMKSLEDGIVLSRKLTEGTKILDHDMTEPKELTDAQTNAAQTIQEYLKQMQDMGVALDQSRVQKGKAAIGPILRMIPGLNRIDGVKKLGRPEEMYKTAKAAIGAMESGAKNQMASIRQMVTDLNKVRKNVNEMRYNLELKMAQAKMQELVYEERLAELEQEKAKLAAQGFNTSMQERLIKEFSTQALPAVRNKLLEALAQGLLLKATYEATGNQVSALVTTANQLSYLMNQAVMVLQARAITQASRNLMVQSGNMARMTQDFMNDQTGKLGKDMLASADATAKTLGLDGIDPDTMIQVMKDAETARGVVEKAKTEKAARQKITLEKFLKAREEINQMTKGNEDRGLRYNH